MLQQLGQVRHHLGQNPRLLPHPHHADIQFAEQFRMLFQGGGKGRAFFHRIGDLQNDGPQRRILLLLAQPIQGLWNRNRRAEQRTHLARERRDVLAGHPPACADCAGAHPAGVLRRSQRGPDRGRPGRGAAFQDGGEKPARTEHLERGLSIRRLDLALDRSAV